MATRFRSDYVPPSDPPSPDVPMPTAPQSGEPGAWEPPPQGEELRAEAADAQIEAFISGVDSQLLDAKRAIEALLDGFAVRSVDAGVQSQEVIDANVVGVGIGLGEGTNGHAGGPPGAPVLEVYTIEPEAPDAFKAKIASMAGVSALSSPDFPVNVVRTGIVDAQPHRMRLRPAPGGISVGHFAITAGTIGCLVRGRSAPRNSRLMVLSNNHVLANSNAASLNDCLCQPGPFDGGRCPGDQIAVLERFVPINFSGACNFVDCATGWAWPDRVRKELMYLSGATPQFFSIGTTPVAALTGMQVGKSGRTTQLTRGTVTAVGVTINVNYGGRIAKFCNQISIRGASGDFSQGGDSGSLIWTWDTRRAPVALLFAGGGGTTFANPIGTVLSALDVSIVA